MRSLAELAALAGRALNEALDLDELLGAVGGALVPGGAAACAVHLLGEGGEPELAALLLAEGCPASVAAALRRPGPALRPAIERGEPELRAGAADSLLAGDVGAADAGAPPEPAATTRLTLPLRARGRPIGALTLVAHGAGRALGAADVPPLRDLAGRLALAVDGALCYGEARARARAEAALRASEERLRAAQDLSLDGFTVLRALRDEGGAIVDFVWEYANPVAGSLLRHRPDELVGRRLLELLPGNRGGLYEAYARVVETGEPHDLEMRYDADGIEGWFRNMAVRIGDGVAVSFSDITARKRAEERLRRLQEISADLAAALTPTEVVEAVIHHGGSVGARAGLVVVLGEDRAHLRLIGSFGYPPEVVRAWSVIPLDARVPLADVVHSGEAVWLSSAEERDRRYPHLAGDASVRDDEAWADAPLVINGTVTGAVGLSFATRQPFAPDDRAYIEALAGHIAQGLERARLYEAAVAARRAVELASKQRDEMAAAVSHDLKNPLTVVTAQAALLRRRLAAAGPIDPAVERSLAAIQRAAGRMNTQIAELLDIARLRGGQPIQLQLGLIDLVALARRCVAENAAVTERHAITLDAPDEPVWGMWDAARLERALGNLLDNAIKYSPAGGAVRVGVAPLPEQPPLAEIVVSDEGLGIPAAELPHIFDLFRRAAALPRSIGGSGVGLASVRQVAEAHGGTVAVESRAGAGTTFRITLPLALPAAQERGGPDD